MTQGTYHLIVVPDSSDLATSMNDDQQAISPDFSVGPIPTLTPDRLAGTSLNAGSSVYYQVAVASTDDVEIQLFPIGFQGFANNADDAVVYASLGTIPSPQDFMLSTPQNAGTPTLVLPSSTSPGTWYIDITGGSQSVGVFAQPRNRDQPARAPGLEHLTHRGQRRVPSPSRSSGSDFGAGPHRQPWTGRR